MCPPFHAWRSAFHAAVGIPCHMNLQAARVHMQSQRAACTQAGAGPRRHASAEVRPRAYECLFEHAVRSGSL